uniref:Olfactory receptor family 10 subfamily D member 3 n=1 Tax=Laticauda laticaudata TaxID=8630 RepID=A0A8C5S9X6_LATLA
MEILSHPVILEFILLGIPKTEGLQNILFVVFLSFYLLTLTGNLLILTAVISDARLYTPMYWFLCNLSVVVLGFSSISTPKFLANLWSGSCTISLGGCTCQVFFYHFLGSTECLLYTVMVYDHYAAICHPLSIPNTLWYSIIMNWKVYAQLAAGTWFTSSFHATILTSLTFTLLYCQSNEVDYFLCDIFPVVNFTNIGVMQSAESWWKAASTCASHLTMVCFFFGPCALLYTQPSLSDILATPIQIFCNVVPLMLILGYLWLEKKLSQEQSLIGGNSVQKQSIYKL